MPLTETPPIRLHDDVELFREAVTFTNAQTGFDPRLIEKDYFCSVVLQYLAATAPTLLFKGGTCLAKVHAGFYRLSEDLDFSIPMPERATRAERSRAAKRASEALAGMASALGAVRMGEPLRGANNSTQYLAELTYESPLDGHTEAIKFEVGLREPLLDLRVLGPANTLLLDPISGESLVPPFTLPCISAREAMAEKIRAALARLTPAIRDFYDLDHATRHGRCDPTDTQLLAFVRQKLSVKGTGPVDVSTARLEKLRGQIATDLRPVLQRAELAAFDLDRAFDIALRVARDVGARQS